MTSLPTTLGAAWQEQASADLAEPISPQAGENDCDDLSASGLPEEAENEPDVDPEDEPLEKTPPKVLLTPSLFADRAATIFFEYPPALNVSRLDQPVYSEELGRSQRLVYKCYWERNCIKNAFIRAGFARLHGSGFAGHWNAIWAKHPSTEAFNGLSVHQKVNHFPGSWCIGRKDRLMRCLERARRRLPREYNFFPEGFILPAEFSSWRRRALLHKNFIWISKPVASSCGKGIRLVHKKNIGTVSCRKKCIMQRYLQNPYLIDGRKFDLRLYVLVTEIDPLRVYLFDEGLARFSTHKYSLKNLKSRFAHLTNYSINKRSKLYVPNEDDTNLNTGSKWSLKALLDKIEELEGPAGRRKAEAGIHSVVVKTLIAAEAEIAPQVHSKVRYRGCCFELFGFDIMLDSKLKAWILEVNISPSLMGSAPIDRKIKGILMADIFHTVGYVPHDKNGFKRELRRRELEEYERLFGVAHQDLSLREDSASHVRLRSNTSERLRSQPAWRKDQDVQSIDVASFGVGDWDVVMDFEDEVARRGHFTLLYPRPDNVMNYIPMFASARLNNHVLANWLLYRRRHRLAEMLADPHDCRMKSLLAVFQDPSRSRRQRRESGSRTPNAATRARQRHSAPMSGQPSWPGTGSSGEYAGTHTRSRQLLSKQPESLENANKAPYMHVGPSVAQPSLPLGRMKELPAGGGARAAETLRDTGPSARKEYKTDNLREMLAKELRQLQPNELKALMGHIESLKVAETAGESFGRIVKRDDVGTVPDLEDILSMELYMSDKDAKDAKTGGRTARVHARLRPSKYEAKSHGFDPRIQAQTRHAPRAELQKSGGSMCSSSRRDHPQRTANKDGSPFLLTW
mmetsp:Transcript_9416/g.35254  ORF Transcript_9416/g.35254 Transcript_9416/m.35254 type:complete len:854 (-) Transcript_9416:251-2812(-)